MAKDGTNRGGRRVRAGAKPDPLGEKLDAGRPATRLEDPLNEPFDFAGNDIGDGAVLAGETMPEPSDYLSEIQRDGKPNGREYNRYRVALQAICGMRTQVTTYEGDDENGMMAGKNLIIADTYNLGWGFKTMGELSTISLNKSTYEHMQHSTSLDAAAVFLLTNTNPLVKGRSRGQDLDLYTWLNARNYSLLHSPSRQTSPITWQQLANQFGNTYGVEKEFVRKIKKSLTTVMVVWPDLNVEVIDGQGIILHRLKRSVTAKRKPTGN